MLTGSEMQFFAVIPRISGHFYIFSMKITKFKKNIVTSNGIDPVTRMVVDHDATATPTG